MSKKLIFATLFSGSSGNCVYLSYGEDAILIDAGKNAKQVCLALEKLGECPRKIKAAFVTHEHCDHIAAFPVLTKKYPFPVHMNEQTASFADKLPQTAVLHEAEYTVEVGPFTVSSFRTPHDSACSVGYTVTVAGKKFAVATDMGMLAKNVIPHLVGSTGALIECNYDEEMLMNGCYPPPLKERVRGVGGHLSNEEGALLAAVLAYSGTEKLLLGHLSEENNTPEKALEAVRKEFVKRDVHSEIAIANRHLPTVLFYEEVEEC